MGKKTLKWFLNCEKSIKIVEFLKAEYGSFSSHAFCEIPISEKILKKPELKIQKQNLISAVGYGNICFCIFW